MKSCSTLTCVEIFKLRMALWCPVKKHRREHVLTYDKFRKHMHNWYMLHFKCRLLVTLACAVMAFFQQSTKPHNDSCAQTKIHATKCKGLGLNQNISSDSTRLSGETNVAEIKIQQVATVWTQVTVNSSKPNDTLYICVSKIYHHWLR